MNPGNAWNASTGEKYGTVLVIHENQRRAKFFEGVLKNGFRVNLATDLNQALIGLRQDSPDLILCDIHSLNEGRTGLVHALENDFDFLDIPLILVMPDRSEECLDTRNLLSTAVDCIAQSIDPCILKWKAVNWISTKVEVARLRKSELEARKRAERMELLVHMVAHDLKSQAVSANGFLRRLKSRLDQMLPHPEMRALIDRISAASQFIEEFLNDLAQALYVTEPTGKREPIRMDMILTQVLAQHEELARAREVKLQVNIEEHLPLVVGNRNRLRQVLDNLLTNALQHMGERPNPAIIITMSSSEGSVITSVSDNGIGVPHEYRDKIFEQFCRAPSRGKKAGSGLGLSIVKHIVESHDGRIWAEFDEEKGSRFYFALPRFEPPQDDRMEIRTN